MTIISVAAKWEARLLHDINKFNNYEPNFKICIVSQSSNQTMSVNDDLVQKYPALKINILTGSDSGITKNK